MFQITIRFSIIIVFLTSGCSQPEVSPHFQSPLARACSFLWEKQNDDGAWRSETHGIMKNGISLTPFIVNALMDVPGDVYPKDDKKVSKAISFIRRQIHTDGSMRGDEIFVLDYPNYATAYALSVLHKYGEEQDKGLIEKMRQYLLDQQFTEKRGIDSSQVAYGAWGFGETELGLGTTGHVDLSHTRRILQSLKEVGAKGDYNEKARHFLGRVQKSKSQNFDGGFFASAVTLLTNKGGKLNEEDWRSYATATCDGLLGLVVSGLDLKDNRVNAAAKWLTENDSLEYPEGIPLDEPAQWHKVMQFYHLAVRAEAFSAINRPGIWTSDMQTLLAGLQKSDGSFVNPMGGPNKEDDPLLATTFAVIALQKAQAISD